MKDRIQQIMESENMPPARFADTLHIGRAIISHILSGRNNPSLDVITRILTKFPDINSDWLISGKGEMYRQQTKVNAESIPQETTADKDIFPGLFAQNYTNSVQPSDENKYAKENEVKAPQNTSNYIEKETIIYKERPEKKITKIIIYYSDNTFETFNPEK